MAIVYIASKFNLVSRVQALYNKLLENGHIVTVNWWDYHGKIKLKSLADDDFYTDDRIKFIRKRDLFGIEQCNVFVLLSSLTKPMNFNGANFELGYATALGKPTYVIGKLDKSALYSDVQWCKNEASFLGRIADP